jgi:hypothetical protein
MSIGMNPLILYDQVSKLAVEPIVIMNCTTEFIAKIQDDYLFNGYTEYYNNYIITSYNNIVFQTRKQLYEYIINIAKLCKCLIKVLSIQNITTFMFEKDYVSYQIIDNNIFAELIIYNNNTLFQLCINDKSVLYHEPTVNRYNRRSIYNYIISKIDEERKKIEYDMVVSRISSIMVE